MQQYNVVGNLVLTSNTLQYAAVREIAGRTFFNVMYHCSTSACARPAIILLLPRGYLRSLHPTRLRMLMAQNQGRAGSAAHFLALVSGPTQAAMPTGNTRQKLNVWVACIARLLERPSAAASNEHTVPLAQRTELQHVKWSD